uniref:CSON004417 protein n=1 Tax=Culicoides sonorensis TaxID=179676 RepID=A0A336L3V8_CULSO
MDLKDTDIQQQSLITPDMLEVYQQPRTYRNRRIGRGNGVKSHIFYWSKRSSRSKRVIVITAIMLTLITSVLIFVVSYTGSSPIHPGHEMKFNSPPLLGGQERLRMVHMVLRHGARTPADTYPNDPHINQTFYPYGWGQLTNDGKYSLFNIGKWAHKRYQNLVGDVYDSKVIHAQSTGVTRTQMSIALVLAGLWEPHGTPLDWNPALNWQPIPYSYEELDKDTLLLVRTSCPRYHEELERVLNSGDIKQIMERNKPLFDELTNITGLHIKTPDDVQSLYSTLKAEEEFGLDLPQWTKLYFPYRLQELTDLSYTLNVHNDELKKLKGGPFLKKMLNEWKMTANKTENLKKMYLYVGHDSTVVNILSAFNAWEPQFPDYTTMAVFELYENQKTGRYSVQILLNKPKQPTQVLSIPGCESPCPLDKLESLLKNHIPSNLTTECQSIDATFTEPPPRGP